MTSHMLSEFLSTGPEPTEKTPTITGDIMQFSWLVVLFTVAFLAHTLEESATTPGSVKHDGVNGSHLLPTHPVPLHPQQQIALQLTLVTLEKQAVVITLTVLASFLEEKKAQNSESF